MTKKDELQRFHKDMISGAAERLFQTKGYESTTMDDIARDADYSKATLYVYFNSKEEIKHFIVLKAMVMLQQKIKKGIASSDDALGQYKAICDELVAFSREYPFHFHSLTETIAADEDSRRRNPVLDKVYLEGERNNALTEQVLLKGIEQGYFREDINKELATEFLLGMTLLSTIQMAKNKEEYIRLRMNMNTDMFLKTSFELLLRTVLKDGVSVEG